MLKTVAAIDSRPFVLHTFCYDPYPAQHIPHTLRGAISTGYSPYLAHSEVFSPKIHE